MKQSDTGRVSGAGRSIRRRVSLRAHVVGALLLALILSACTSGGAPGADAGESSSRVIPLGEVSELTERFNNDAGAIRLVLLVSPT